ncbi:NADH-quinone oxidoreductase subunit L, partial [Paraburkholderia sp. SIMBA_050]
MLAIPLAPLAGAAIAGLFGTKFFGTFSSDTRGGRIVAHTATILGVAIAFVLSLLVLRDVMDGAGYNGTVYEWMAIGSLKMEVGFL